MLNPQLSNMVITPEGLASITAQMSDLLKETNARTILLVEKSGQHLASVGEEYPHVMAIAALIVGAFSSARELSRLIGEPDFKTMFQQGKTSHVYISMLETQDMITVIFDERTTLGIIKLKTQQMIKKISDEILKMSSSGSTNPLAKDMHHTEFLS